MVTSPSLCFSPARHVKGKGVLIVTNTTIAPLYLERTIAALKSARENAGGDLDIHSVILPDGEEYKDLVRESSFDQCSPCVCAPIPRKCPSNSLSMTKAQL